MLRVKWTETGTYANGGVLKDGFTSSEDAEQYIQDSFLNEPGLRDSILQLVQVDGDGEEIVVTEYEHSDFVNV
jgi:hypothetical protein